MKDLPKVNFTFLAGHSGRVLYVVLSGRLRTEEGSRVTRHYPKGTGHDRILQTLKWVMA